MPQNGSPLSSRGRRQISKSMAVELEEALGRLEAFTPAKATDDAEGSPQQNGIR
ncbi:hypothetical protein [Legionella gratiana]|uniref:hypothetical protein n=1 Tax=Legionella gratiana TaxID=45066 RepID=UPI000AC3044D|nr:hypothetical protein [Legionella gratiana]